MAPSPVFQNVVPQELASQWASRIGARMREMGIPEEEVVENVNIIESFCKTAAEILQKEPDVVLPNREPIPLDDERAHLVVDLFLRGVNQASSQMRRDGIGWERRKVLLETIAWRIFNLSKLLVGLQLDPVPTFQDVLKQDKDLKMMMRHSTDELIRQAIAGTSPPQ
ncbi:MAG: hypothetical protein VKJ04_09925 [Vampirovibrionales bacterium]|nr:hypothetical protein [Vampirovibrionales bacterium]